MVQVVSHQWSRVGRQLLDVGYLVRLFTTLFDDRDPRFFTLRLANGAGRHLGTFTCLTSSLQTAAATIAVLNACKPVAKNPNGRPAASEVKMVTIR